MALLLTIVLCMLTVSGCWDRREVNDIAIVIAMAVDKEAEGVRLSVQVPLVSHMGGTSGGGGGTSGEKSYYVDSAVGKTMRDAHNKMQSRMSRHIYYAHHRIVVIGESLAKDGFRESLDIISRFPENRLTAYIVATKGKAISLLEAQPQFERFSGEAIRELVKAVAIPVTIKDVSQMLNTPGVDPFLPIFEAVNSQPKGKSKEIQSTGIAAFRGERLVTTYTAEEAKGLRWFQRTFDPFSVILDLGKKGRFSLYLQKGKADIKPVLKNGKIHFDIRVYTTAGIVENMSDLDLEERKINTMLENHLAKEVTKGIVTILERTKKTKADTIGLGIVLARNYPDLWKSKYREVWHDELPRITYSVKTQVQISNVGQTTTNITKEDP
ncbi:Ger(x)C family spore germination protein [Brevibacillus choshinensis]|nr:Ger(x)C family spore germination protein [Brevibacillus choshinensis]